MLTKQWTQWNPTVSTQQWTQLGLFFRNQGTFFDLQKRAGETFPTSSHSCVHAIIL